MEHFPQSFVAQKIQHNIEHNRVKKIEQDLKSLRKKIVRSFEKNVNYHCEVTHDMLSDLSDEEQKQYYNMVKEELQERGFIVRGKISNNTLSLIIFSNSPRTNEMDKVLRSYEESGKSLDNSSDNSTPFVERKSAIPKLNHHKFKKAKSMGTLRSKPDHNVGSPTLSTATSPSKIPQLDHSRNASTSPCLPRLHAQPPTHLTSPLAEKDKPAKNDNGVAASSISSSSLPSSLLSSQPPSLSSSLPLPSSPTLPNPIPIPLSATSQSTIGNSTPQSTEEPRPFSTDLNMDFILNKLKQANRKK